MPCRMPPCLTPCGDAPAAVQRIFLAIALALCYKAHSITHILAAIRGPAVSALGV
jgi:hypothetical protein